MTSYRMNGKNGSGIFNKAVIEFIPCDSYFSGREKALETCGRFVQAAAALPEGSYLGWEVGIDDQGAISNIVFSSMGTCVTEEDYRWIFETNLAGITYPSASPDWHFRDEKKVYCLTAKPGTEPDDGKNGRRGGYMGYEYGDEKEVRHYINLLNMMESVKGASLRMLVQGAGEGTVAGGVILLSLPCDMTLRMKAAFFAAFPAAFVREIGTEAEAMDQMIHLSCITDGMAGMQQAVMYCGAKEGSSGESSDSKEKFPDCGFAESADMKETKTEEKETEILAVTPLEDLDLSIRPYNCLRRAGVDSVEKLRAMSDEELRKVRNLGRRAFEEVRDKIASFPEPEKDVALTAVNYMAMLDELIGLAAVKEQIRKIAAYAQMKRDMRDSGKPDVPIALNMEFVGNPGTAKTTVARILAGIFHEIGLLDTGKMVEVGRADLIAKYEGQTADKVKNVFKAAKGKLLFIDEAYSLVEQWEGSYGDEAIDTIVMEMENRRDDTIVIFAGYPKEMEDFFSRNPGLRSRVPFKITFSDYSPEEMEQISEKEAEKRGFTIQAEAKDKVAELCRDAKSAVNVGNGRFCRNLVENAILGYASRIYGEGSNDAIKDFVLTEADFSAASIPDTEKAVVPIGFRAA